MTGDWELVFLLSTQHSALSSQQGGLIVERENITWKDDSLRKTPKPEESWE
ncbi:MAG: hypothetical protein V7L07_13915 [Nostoc sp.]